MRTEILFDAQSKTKNRGEYIIGKRVLKFLFTIIIVIEFSNFKAFANESALQDICKIKSAAEFVSKFSESTKLQSSLTIFPLKYSFLQPTAVDYEERYIFVENLKELKFHFASKGYLFPDKIDMQKFRLKYNVEVDDKDIKVKLYELSADNLTYYYFRKINNCWKLFKIDSKSM